MNGRGGKACGEVAADLRLEEVLSAPNAGFLGGCGLGQHHLVGLDDLSEARALGHLALETLAPHQHELGEEGED